MAAAGRLRTWAGGELVAERHEDNPWCRREPGGAWALDVTVGNGDDRRWHSRRDRLRCWLPDGHPWQALLDGSG